MEHQEATEEAAQMLAEGGPAFPAVGTRYLHSSQGMSLRDWFAGKALAGLVSAESHVEGNPWSDDKDWFEDTARRAYQLADAMLEERTR